jgi:signal peptidase II
MKRRPLFFLILALVVLLDQLTKYLASTFIDPYGSVELLPVLRLVNVRNEGAAFGMFSSFGNAAFIVITVLAIALIAYLIVRDKEGFVPLTLILSGAVGNLMDRLALGYVRDFIDFHAGSYHWPAFNVADSALTIGIVLLVLLSVFPRKGKIAS